MNDEYKKSFSWGQVIECFTYDFDGEICKIVKYHPWKVENGTLVKTGRPDKSKINYKCDQINRSSDNLELLILHWMVEKRLGKNQAALVQKIARAMKIESEETK